MTHRDKIRADKRLTPEVVALLKRYYPGCDLAGVPIYVKVPPTNDPNNAYTSPWGITFWIDVWNWQYPANLLVLLCHELTHWEWLQTHWFAIVRWWLSSAKIKQSLEDEAQARQQRIKFELTSEQMGILDRSV